MHWLGNSEKGSRISEFDWSTTPLGPLENWPSGVKREWAQSLRADKVAPEQLQTSGERSLNQAVELRAVIESLNDAIYIGGLNGITLANQVALDQLGYRSTEELNRNIGALAQEIDTRDANTGEQIALERQPFARALGGEKVVQEVKVRHLRTGEERILRSAAAPVVMGGKVIAAVAINTDITDHKTAEQALAAGGAGKISLEAQRCP